MALDRNNKPVKKGDAVSIPATIKSIPDDAGDNASIVVEIHDGGSFEVNSKQVELQ